VILGAPDVSTCVQAQYAWLEETYFKFETLIHTSMHDGRMLSGLKIQTPEEELNICFDISDCEDPF
jgi:hypothetical protein